MSMQIVIYRSQHCPACRRLSAELTQLCRKLDATAESRDVLEHLEAAARLGIRQPPAVVIDGRLFGQGAAVLGKLKRRLSA
ncbi:MAG: glutaredoxin [Gammaproteobacteria bacterium]|nr:glutaredoxin [Gammaproteobacteria bacterium]